MTDENELPESQDSDYKIQNQKTDAEITKLTAETGKLLAETEQIKSRYSRLLQLLTQVLPSVIAVLSISLAIRQFESSRQLALQQIESNKQSDKTRQQQEQFHQDALFSNAISQLGSSEPKDRAAAIAELAEYATHSSSYNNHALTLINLELQTETDPAVLQVGIQALSPLGRPALDILIENNRLVYDQLARAIGQYLSIQSLLHPINIVSIGGSSAEIDQMKPNVYWVKMAPSLADLVRQGWTPVMRASGLWQEKFLVDTLFFQRWDLAKHPAYSLAFRETSKNHRKLAPNAEQVAKQKFLASVRDLWVNTQAIVSVLKPLSGKLGGANLRGTILLHPHLAGVDLRGIDARSAIWMAPVLANSDLSFANLSDSEMKYANLWRTNLMGADIARVNFGQKNDKSINDIELRTFTELRHIQTQVNLHGTNLWEMANCYLRDNKFDPTKLAELKKQREETLANAEAKSILSKITQIVIDD